MDTVADRAPRFDVAKLQGDLDSRGWLPRDLARAAGMSPMTVSRVLKGQRWNPRTWDKLARGLGYTAKRYVLRSDRQAVAS